MAFTSRAPAGRAAAEQFPNTRFLLGQPYTWIDLPRALLSVPLPGAGFGGPRPPADEAGSGGGFSASLRQLLRPYLREGYPHLELAAEIAGTSVRTLQRRLERAGLSYSGLVQQVRFDAARRLLEDPDVKMIDVAYDPGLEQPRGLHPRLPTPGRGQPPGVSPAPADPPAGGVKCKDPRTGAR